MQEPAARLGVGSRPFPSGVTTSCSAGGSDVSGIFSPSNCGSYSVCSSHRVSRPGSALTTRSKIDERIRPEIDELPRDRLDASGRIGVGGIAGCVVEQRRSLVRDDPAFAERSVAGLGFGQIPQFPP